MKKIITLISALTISTVTTIPLLACGDKLDSILKIINEDNNSNYELWDLGIDNFNKPNPPDFNQNPKAEQELSDDTLKEIGKNIANKILTKAKSQLPKWFDDNLSDNTKCYQFNINNDNASFWEVDAVTGKITVSINYQVGNIKNKKFEQQQQITKIFKLKCAYTQSDYKVYNLASTINKLKEIKITLTDATNVHENYTYNLFNKDTKLLIEKAIKSACESDPNYNSVTIIVKENDEYVKKINEAEYTYQVNFILIFQDSILDMSLSPSYYDTKTTYEPITLKFVG